jgi:hypothetical protein
MFARHASKAEGLPGLGPFARPAGHEVTWRLSRSKLGLLVFLTAPENDCLAWLVVTRFIGSFAAPARCWHADRMNAVTAKEWIAK